MKRKYHFKDEMSENVDVTLPGSDYSFHGLLTASPNKLIHLSLSPKSDSDPPGENTLLLKPPKEIPLIHCKNHDNSFTLANCKLSNASSIYPQSILEGKVESSSFKSLKLRLHGLSTWFHQQTDLKHSKRSFAIKGSPKPFRVIVERGDNQRLEISLQHPYKIKKIGADFQLRQNTEIEITCLSDKLSLIHIEEISHEIRQLFVLLLGGTIYTERLWVQQDSKWIPTYFENMGKEKDNTEQDEHFFVDRSKMFNRKDWKKIFVNYYSPEHRENFKELWSRMVGLHFYNDIWNYEILGYASILDRYTEKKCAGQKTENFKDRFECSMKNTPLGIRCCIKFSPEEFVILKEYRDAAAHGRPCQYDKSKNLTSIFKIKDKLWVLLTYFVFKEFGLTDKKFIKCLRLTWHKSVLNAELDEREIDRANGVIEFINTDDKHLERLKKSLTNPVKLHTVIKTYESHPGKYQYDEYGTKMIRENRCSDSELSSNEYLELIYAGDNIVSVHYHNKVYFESAHDWLEVFCPNIVTFKKPTQPTHT